MHHVAILRKSNLKNGDDLLGDILKGTKTIESRWYVNRIAPWNRIDQGDSVYFKESGCEATARAEVSKVIRFENLNFEKAREIIEKYGKQIAPNETKKEWREWARKNSKKRYCILIFLENVQKIEPFEIDKTGYGNACAWMVTEDIDSIKKY
jgi:hypothetical protein